MADQPTGLVTMLFTDVEGSTKLLDRLGPDRYAESLELHRNVLRQAADSHNAYEVAYEGDSFFFAFADAGEAVAAAAEAQRGLEAAEWPDGLPFRVRMGIHAGEVLAVPPKYVGLEVHRAARIMAAAHGGQVVVSADAMKLAGADGLDLGEHRLKDLLQPIRLYQLPSGPGLERFPPLRSLSDHPTNLPIQPNDLIGRRDELAELSALLAAEHVRLVTLVGVGGAGKTRLALQAAADAADRFPSGAYAVFLASVRDPDLVAGAIAEALGAHEVAGATIEENLVEHLRERELLLLLDNFEQVGAAAGLVAKLLEACPRLRVLVTSRTRLRLRAEHLYAVPPLNEADAVDLLLARIEAAGHGRTTELQAMEELGQISRRLDGLPLALELVAPLLSTYAPSDLLARMDRRLELLTDGPLDLSERQRTLRAAIEWSYELLPPPARELLARSSVFVGGATLEALETVCGSDIRSLTALTDGSLARVERGRMLLLETIREFAAEELERLGHADEVRARHAAFFLELAREADERLFRQEEDALEVFEPDHDNLRAALHFFEEHDPVLCLDLASRCAWFWFLRGHWREGRGWLGTAFAHVQSPLPPALRGRALMRLGGLAEKQGDLDAAEESWTEALEIRRSAHDLPGMSAALNNLGNVALARDDFAAAKVVYSEALAVGRETGDPGNCASALCNLGIVAWREADYAAAEPLLLEALELAKEIGTRYGQAIVENTLGAVALDRGDLAGAATRYRASLRLARELDDPDLAIDPLEELAGLAVALGDPEAAAFLLGAGHGIRERHGLERQDVGGRTARTRAAVRELLDSENYSVRFDEGTNATEDDAAAFASSRVAEPAEAVQAVDLPER